MSTRSVIYCTISVDFMCNSITHLLCTCVYVCVCVCVCVYVCVCVCVCTRVAQTVLLAYLFLNGPQEEREHITTQLYSVFNSEDLDNIYLASRCLCEILEEANFQSQVSE